jgi:hypothetical protein
MNPPTAVTPLSPRQPRWKQQNIDADADPPPALPSPPACRHSLNSSYQPAPTSRHLRGAAPWSVSSGRRGGAATVTDPSPPRAVWPPPAARGRSVPRSESVAHSLARTGFIPQLRRAESARHGRKRESEPAHGPHCSRGLAFLGKPAACCTGIRPFFDHHLTNI